MAVGGRQDSARAKLLARKGFPTSDTTPEYERAPGNVLYVVALP